MKRLEQELMETEEKARRRGKEEARGSDMSESPGNDGMSSS
jgi:hypothetical protein